MTFSPRAHVRLVRSSPAGNTIPSPVDRSEWGSPHASGRVLAESPAAARYATSARRAGPCACRPDRLLAQPLRAVADRARASLQPSFSPLRPHCVRARPAPCWPQLSLPRPAPRPGPGWRGVRSSAPLAVARRPGWQNRSRSRCQRAATERWPAATPRFADCGGTTARNVLAPSPVVPESARR